jgi:hypothetical protein
LSCCDDLSRRFFVVVAIVILLVVPTQKHARISNESVGARRTGVGLRVCISRLPSFAPYPSPSPNSSSGSASAKPPPQSSIARVKPTSV